MRQAVQRSAFSLRLSCGLQHPEQFGRGTGIGVQVLVWAKWPGSTKLTSRCRTIDWAGLTLNSQPSTLNLLHYELVVQVHSLESVPKRTRFLYGSKVPPELGARGLMGARARGHQVKRRRDGGHYAPSPHLPFSPSALHRPRATAVGRSPSSR